MTPLRTLLAVFARLGVLGFGGPAAHVAMMREEFVTRRGWFDDRDFLRMVAATNLIPGPNSTELAMHIGSRRSRGRGLVVAGVAFIVPAVVIVGAIAWLYSEHGTDPAVVDVRYGVLPVIIAIVAHATWGLARSTLTAIAPSALAALAVAAYLAGINELLILAIAGVCAVVAGRLPRASGTPSLALPAVFASVVADPTLARIGAVFVQVGALLYGSGYVLVAYLDARLVETGLLTAEQLLDAVAVGQITPGPVFSTATFIGWQLGGVWGAIVATVAIFAPSFLFVALLGKVIDFADRHETGRNFLDGVVAGSLGLLVGVLVRLSDAAVVDWFTAALAVVALGALVTRKLGASHLVLIGVAVGIVRALG
jgi:chromate transporter